MVEEKINIDFELTFQNFKLYRQLFVQLANEKSSICWTEIFSLIAVTAAW